MVTKQLIMVEPSNFCVNYSINPWMDGNIGSVQSALATEQWFELRKKLTEAGARIAVLPSFPGCPDDVFVANAGLLFNGLLLPSQFRFEERAPEEKNVHAAFTWLDFSVADASWIPGERTTQSFEGAGDALFSIDRKVLWVGTGFRTSQGIDRLLAQYISATVIELELVDPRFYHLDTCFCPLDTGDLLWYPPAFSARSQRLIEKYHTTGKHIFVDRDAALAFSCNAVSIGKSIVLPETTVELAIYLEALGYNVLRCNMSEFMKAGGACKCLTLENVV